MAVVHYEPGMGGVRRKDCWAVGSARGAPLSLGLAS